MRKIDKSVILSENYKNWLQEKRDKDKTHKTCSYYKVDVVMNLLYCQKGVCAYTEMLLSPPDLIEKSNWKEGKYINKKVTKDTFGDLEHFDPKQKAKYFCEWDNLFVINHKVNILKNDTNIDLIKEFKPDSKGYNPFDIFDYDIDTNKFRPNTDIKDKYEANRIKDLIKLLSINQHSIKYERETFLNDVKANKNKKIDRFFTAYEMSKSYL